MKESFAKRVNSLRQRMSAMGVDTLVLSPSPNLFYLTGYSPKMDERIHLAFIGVNGESLLLVPHMYLDEATQHCWIQDRRVWRDGDAPAELVSEVAKAFPVGTSVALEDTMPFRAVHVLSQGLVGAKFRRASDIMNDLRIIKSPEELHLMRKSAAISDEVTGLAVGLCTKGLSEIEVKRAVEHELNIKGITGELSNSVASGQNSAMPHHISGGRQIQPGDAVYMDLGGTLKGYWSDVTRTVFVGEPSREFRKAYEAVKDAQEAAVRSVKPGVTAGSIDRLARDLLRDAGYAGFILHRTGHGIGLELHEEPSIVSSNDTVLREGMVHSVEPGLYFPGRFGIRIEDIVVVTSGGCERLNKFTRELVCV